MLASRPDSEISPLILCTRFGEPILLNNVLGGAQEINQIRNQRAKGEKVETPYYIQVVKEELTKVGDMFSFPLKK